MNWRQKVLLGTDFKSHNLGRKFVSRLWMNREVAGVWLGFLCSVSQAIRLSLYHMIYNLQKQSLLDNNVGQSCK